MKNDLLIYGPEVVPLDTCKSHRPNNGHALCRRPLRVRSRRTKPRNM